MGPGIIGFAQKAAGRATSWCGDIFQQGMTDSLSKEGVVRHQ
jgi:hypothetical protein